VQKKKNALLFLVGTFQPKKLINAVMGIQYIVVGGDFISTRPYRRTSQNVRGYDVEVFGTNKK
jgi:hypothetical protein